jgi:uncharacterized integral membrane protein (TIGR00698 family)
VKGLWLNLPGIGAALGVAVVALAVARVVPLIGAPIVAIALGIALRALVPLPVSLNCGIKFSSRNLLQAAIVVSGFGLSLVTVVHTGVATLPVTLCTIAVVLLLGPLLGRFLNVGGALNQLISIGTAICGASAIAAASTVLEPPEEIVALAIATVFFYNLIAVVLFPPLGHLMQLSQSAFGVWAGTAINDTSSVVAAGYAYGPSAGAEATIVKLTRATFILPVVGVLAVLVARARRAEQTAVPWKRIIPWFIGWFLLAALIQTSGIIPDRWHAAIVELALLLITAALAAIGMSTNVRALFRSGLRPLALGFLLWVAIAIASLVVQHATGA